MSELSQTEREELEKLRAEKAAKTSGKCSFKVSEKGAVSVYGLGRFPVTLYKGQWDKLLAQIDELKTFIQLNESSLSVKE